MRSSLDNAVERLKAQSQEMVSELEAAGLAAIERIRAKQTEDQQQEDVDAPRWFDTQPAPMTQCPMPSAGLNGRRMTSGGSRSLT